MLKLFVKHAIDILGETSTGLSGAKIAEYSTEFALKYGIDIPYSTYPFPMSVGNKRSAFYANIKCFNESQQITIIYYLSKLEIFDKNERVAKIKSEIASRYSSYILDETEDVVLNEEIENTKHWLREFPESKAIFDSAIEKYRSKLYQRNILDDLRLCLEKTAQAIVGNEKSLENNVGKIGSLVNESGGSVEFRNMFNKLLDYYAKYQNEHVKHDDDIVEHEIDFVLEITCSFLKTIIKCRGK